MAIAFVDTNIIIDYLRANEDERIVKYVDGFDVVYINDIVAMELFQGARNKRELNYIKNKIMKFEVLVMNQGIITLAREMLVRYTLSHNMKIMDALIAATVITYNLDLYTLNKKDFRFIEGITLV